MYWNEQANTCTGEFLPWNSKPRYNFVPLEELCREPNLNTWFYHRVCFNNAGDPQCYGTWLNTWEGQFITRTRKPTNCPFVD